MNNEDKITILTKTPKLFFSRDYFYPKIKILVKIIFNFLLYKNKKNNWKYNKYGGHYAVTRSIVDGFKKNKTSFNINPKERDVSEIVYVPGGIDALKYAISLKEKDKIKKLIAGPNIVVFPNEITEITNNKLIDLYVQPSEWIIKWWKTLYPKFPIQIKSWYAGVDTNFWRINKNKNIEKNIALYKKRVPENFFIECKNYLEKKGFNVEIINYGFYTTKEYKKYLKNNSCIIHFVDQESQGISLAEAWSTNTPTIVWNPGDFLIDGKINYNGSSAPYLTPETGDFFKDIQEFKDIFDKWNPSKYNPRKWVLENMSDEICAKKLISIIKDENINNNTNLE